MTENRGAAGLGEIGSRRGILQAAEGLDYLKTYASVMATLALPVHDIVMILNPDLAESANTFAEAFPEATVHFLGTGKVLDEAQLAQLLGNVRYAHCIAIADRRDYLRRIDRPQVMIEHGNNKLGQKRACFRHLFWALPDGGVYFIERLDASHDPKLIDSEDASVVELLNEAKQLKSLSPEEQERLPKREREIVGGIADVRTDGTLGVVQKAGDHLFKMRDWEANAFLAARRGDAWGEVIETKPGYSFEPRALLSTHGDGPIDSASDRTIEVPDRFLRRYRNPTCSSLQIVTQEGVFLPDTFRHPHQRRQMHRDLAATTPFLDRISPRLTRTSRRVLEGEFFHFDTELPGHFGHITTEVLSRYWGWKIAVKQNPSIRPILCVDQDKTSIPGFQALIFDALGVPVDDIEYIQETEEVQVESLVAATPQFENPYYVDLELVDVWRDLAAKLPADDGTPRGEKIFISRRPGDKRDCRNGPAVEDLFREHGFDIIYPEDHPYVEQTHIFAAARIIAGFGGSGMFNMMFAPDARIILLAGASYKAANEYLFAAANGNEVHYFWGESEIQGTEGRFSTVAFRSNFSIDLDRHHAALVPLLH